jgi:hypothetical protein
MEKVRHKVLDRTVSVAESLSRSGFRSGIFFTFCAAPLTFIASFSKANSLRAEAVFSC